MFKKNRGSAYVWENDILECDFFYFQVYAGRPEGDMFNAENFIIGLSSGLMGVLITYLLCIPINFILHNLTGISTLSVFLLIPAAALFVLISVVLTLVAGIIPSRSAAKKDPVVALRTA